MQAVATIGLDIAKSVFQVHGVDADSQVVVRRQLKRRYVLAFFQKLRPCWLVLRPPLSVLCRFPRPALSATIARSSIAIRLRIRVGGHGPLALRIFCDWQSVAH